MRKTEFLATACDPKSLTVGHLMQDTVFTCGTRVDALSISRMLTQRNFGSLPVVEEDRTLVGLISEYDLLQAMIDGRDLQQPSDCYRKYAAEAGREPFPGSVYHAGTGGAKRQARRYPGTARLIVRVYEGISVLVITWRET
jgi:predicted transcriptional regulator